MSADRNAELNALRLEAEALRRERNYYRSTLCGLLAQELENIDVNRQELMALVGTQEPIEEYLKSLRAL